MLDKQKYLSNVKLIESIIMIIWYSADQWLLDKLRCPEDFILACVKTDTFYNTVKPVF